MPNSNTDVVCLLDDDPSVPTGLSRLLKSTGWHAEQFSDPEKFQTLADGRREAPARDDLAAREIAMQIGPVAFFIKPFDDEQFLAAVRDAMSKANSAK